MKDRHTCTGGSGVWIKLFAPLESPFGLKLLGEAEKVAKTHHMHGTDIIKWRLTTSSILHVPFKDMCTLLYFVYFGPPALMLAKAFIFSFWQVSKI